MSQYDHTADYKTVTNYTNNTFVTFSTNNLTDTALATTNTGVCTDTPPPSPTTTNTDTNLSFGSLNTRGQHKENVRKHQYRFMQYSNYDVTFFQENHGQPNTNTTWANQWGTGPSFFANNTTQSGGISIHFGNKTKPNIEQVIQSSSGRYIWVRATLQNQTYGLLNVHCPDIDAQQLEFLENIYHFLRINRTRGMKIILGGVKIILGGVKPEA